MRTVGDVLRGITPNDSGGSKPLPKPPYYPVESRRESIALAVESMRRHMTDEGWQIMLGLRSAGYSLVGKDCDFDLTEVREILSRFSPKTLVIQDKREWLGITADKSRDPSMMFKGVRLLREEESVFKLTVVKDAQHDPTFHREAADEIGCHGWIVYYHPLIVSRLAPYVRPEHIVRTYHTVDKNQVPPYAPREGKVLLSGAISRVYPLRSRLRENLHSLPEVTLLKHPGYHRKGCVTPEFLRTLSGYRVSICTSSNYGYLLRKIIESTAAGCIVVTDLPSDEIVPEIDGNLIRVSVGISIPRIREILREAINSYHPGLQEDFAERARKFYDYRRVGAKLAADIETLRLTYNERSSDADSDS